MIAVEDIEIGGVYRAISYDTDTGDIEEISFSLCYSKRGAAADFVDLGIELSHPDSHTGFKWAYNTMEDEDIFKIEYIGNEDTHPEYFL